MYTKEKNAMTEKQYEELAEAVAKVKALMQDTDIISVDISKNFGNARILLSHDGKDKADWEIRPFTEKSNQKVKTVNGVDFVVLIDNDNYIYIE